MAARVPVIGLMGGIASGKSFYARALGRLGCVVVDADEVVGEIYRRGEVVEVLRGWWGEGVVKADGGVDRGAVGRIVFGDEAARRRLEGLVHPEVIRVCRERVREVRERRDGVAGVGGVVWDVPLLLETGLDRECDVLVFVETPEEVRRERAGKGGGGRGGRGWAEGELERREGAQRPLEEKRRVAGIVVRGDVGEKEVEEGARRILAEAGGQGRRKKGGG